MTDHSITPPPELVQQWATASPIQSNDENWAYELFIAHHAAQWGADQELEACCEWLEDWVGNDSYAVSMRAARRPKPSSLKEEALGGLDQLAVRLTEAGVAVNLDTIRRALEALPND